VLRGGRNAPSFLIGENVKNLITTILYHLRVFYHHPFNIRIGKLHFYSYKIHFWDRDNWRFENYSNDEFYGDKRKIRWAFNYFGYSFDFNIYE
jgi:hypothetical protein